MEVLDYVIFSAYLFMIFFVGVWIAKKKKNKNEEDYFLASKSLPWWIIGASLIAANISAEQFIGMTGSGFAIGLAIATYEWLAAITLLIVGKWFLPIFISQKIYTIPQFIEKRYSTNLKTILAVFWLALFVFVNLSTVMYLGAKALDTIIGPGDGSSVIYFCLGLAVFTLSYSLRGGLSSVAWTDVFQVAVLVFGGVLTTFITLSYIGDGGGIFSGMLRLAEMVPEKFSMIIEKGEVFYSDGRDAWWDLPGVYTLLGGMWVAHIYYWGFNQYIIQRALAAKSIQEAQKGLLFASGLKMIIPFIVVLPGIIAYAIITQGNPLDISMLDTGFISENNTVVYDNAFPWLIKNFLPIGIKGLIVAGITAAIVSSLASMSNSIATIFSMDIYKPLINPQASSSKIVKTGRITIVFAFIVAILIAIQLGNLGQIFQYIQEYTGIVSPGILVVFLLGLFTKKATNKAAILGILFSMLVAIYFKIGQHGWIDSAFFIHLPFLRQMFFIALATAIFITLFSYFQNKGHQDKKALHLEKDIFKTPNGYAIGSFGIILLCIAIYAIFW